MTTSHQRARTSAVRSASVALVIMLIALGSVLLASFALKGPELDSDDCPLKATDRTNRATFFFIDTTDSIDGNRRDAAVAFTRQLAQSTRKYERLTVYILNNESSANIGMAFSRCSPVSSFVDRFSSGSTQLKHKYVDSFEKPLLDSISNALAVQKPSKTSPIIESIREIRKSTHWGQQNRLYIWSDMLEHSSVADLYKPGLTFKSVAESKSGALVKNIDLGETMVAVCRLDHPAGELSPKLQENADKFWGELFHENLSGKGESCVIDGCSRPDSVCPKLI